MHAEFIDIPIDTLRQLRSQYPNLIAVGTTSLRTLESLYWMGVKAHLTPNLDLPELEVKQWEAYDIPLQDLPVTDALDALLQWMETNHHERLICKTQILMAPPYNIRMCKALITNFHQPESTLLLLIATVVGEQHWKKIYDYALAHDYRFLSYGDGSLLWME